MKVCIFFPIFPPRFGGGTIQALKLADELRRKGVDIFFVALTDCPWQRGSGKYEGVEVHYIFVNDLDIYIEGQSTLIDKLKIFIKLFVTFIRLRKKYSIIHIQGMGYPYTSLSILAKLYRKKTLAKVSMLQEVNFKDCGRIFGMISRYSALKVDRLIAISSLIRDRLIEDNFKESKVRYIPNSVDIQKYHPLSPDQKKKLKRELNIDNQLVITFVGGITYRKGVDRLVSMWPAIFEKYPDSCLFLVGPLSEKEGATGDKFCYEEIKKDIKDKELGEVIQFTGRVDNVAEYLQISDLFVFPSTMEGMPNVLLETMACGVPAISYRVSGVDDIIVDGENGRIINVGDESAFREAVIELLRDEDKRSNYSREAREKIVDIFSLDSISDLYIEIYDSLAES
ncbi:MAG: glycosyltransferase family 4 protein [Candidatus Krumholzibacteriota bacterium]|nr:glycosyltransferase family 4 protein [Candidatus Krumholzibacteriota bacterium]